jgi:E3 ubiquitin-protein ligase RNF14
VRQAQPVAAADRHGQQDPNNLNPQQEAWVRQFVQLALNDEEDLVDWDSDE